MTVLAALAAAPSASAEQSGTRTNRLAAGQLAAGGLHTCAILANGTVRCWGYNGEGELGYGNTDSIGDNEVPSAAGPVALGAGRTARAIAAGDQHACAILDNGKVRCWGWNGTGQLGLGHVDSIGDGETPASVPAVNLGAGRRAVAITAGGYHTCVILDTGAVRCWGFASSGQLGYGNDQNLGDDELPSTVGTVALGPGRRAVAITAGGFHTCAILDNGAVRCWGRGLDGQLGYGNTNDIGNDETPASVGPVALGTGRNVVAISAGSEHTCAILDTGAVRCWGKAASGQLGYGNVDKIGDGETPDTVGPVDLGAGRTAVGISSGLDNTCVVLDTRQVRCWGYAAYGTLGYGNTDEIGDDETPGSVGPVDFGTGRTAVALSLDTVHTCVILDTAAVRCWGGNSNGKLGYGHVSDVGGNASPGDVGPVDIGGLVRTRVTPLLTLGLSPARDRRAPFTFKAAGTLRGFLGDSVTCSGALVVTAKKGAKTVVRRPSPKPSAAGCAYAASFRVRGQGTWRVTARFAGNSSLRPPPNKTKTFRAG